jgi:hypothetical protein
VDGISRGWRFGGFLKRERLMAFCNADNPREKGIAMIEDSKLDDGDGGIDL